MKETLQFYKAAKAYKNAIRIARTNNMPGEVMQLSLQADTATIIDSAEWFEEQGVLPKAVILYKKAGELAKAIDLCVRGSHFDTLQKLADDLDKDTDPEVFIQCAQYFVSKDQHEKAVRMYIQARGYSEALQVQFCVWLKLNFCIVHDPFKVFFFFVPFPPSTTSHHPTGLPRPQREAHRRHGRGDDAPQDRQRGRRGTPSVTTAEGCEGGKGAGVMASCVQEVHPGMH